MLKARLARTHPATRILLAAFVAGTLATIVQMLLWWIEGTPVFATLIRDARLTAAIVLGDPALKADMASQWSILAWATFVHLLISVVYTVPAWPVGLRLAPPAATAVGMLYGGLIYAINLHGFTALFPWFDISRGWVTFIAHLVFGASLLATCSVLARIR